MDFMESQVTDPVPTMSRAKQARIDIWRNEVAALTIPAIPDPGSPSSPTSLISPSTSASSPSGSSSSMLSWPHEESRTRRLWKRLSRRLTSRDGEAGKGDGTDSVIRTQMYQAERAVQESKGDALEIADESSEDHARGGLKEKQERLGRAARLLNQGAARDF